MCVCVSVTKSQVVEGEVKKSRFWMAPETETFLCISKREHKSLSQYDFRRPNGGTQDTDNDNDNENDLPLLGENPHKIKLSDP